MRCRCGDRAHLRVRMKREIVFLMACALMIAGIALIVNSIFDFIGKTKDGETNAVVYETADTTEQTDS